MPLTLFLSSSLDSLFTKINLQSHKKKALKVSFISIKKSSQGLINNAIRHLGTVERASESIPTGVSCSIIKAFNESIKGLADVLSQDQIDVIRKIPFETHYSEQAFNYGQLLNLAAECEKVISFLEDDSDKSKKYPFKIKNKLSSLRDQIELLEISDLSLKKNVEMSLDLFEEGKTFCSALFASRVISYTIDQIKIEKSLIEENESLKHKQNMVELIITDFVNKGLIKKNEKKYQSNLLMYVKLARNQLLHNLDFVPDDAESLGLLSNSIKLLGLKNKYDEFTALNE